MFFLDEPYVSDFLIETIRKNNYPVLDNPILKEKNLNTVTTDKIYSSFIETNHVYSNSENSIDIIKTYLKDTKIPYYIDLFKDKVSFREILSKLYPDFYFRKVSYNELINLDKNSISYPVVIKPAVGFLSFGVYSVYNSSEFEGAIKAIVQSIEKTKGMFPESVLNCDNFIIEKYIEGIEYALDVYYDENSNPVILNLFYHPFLNKYDVSDRMYVSSPSIIMKYKDKLSPLLNGISKLICPKNFPMHIELRINGDEIVPIEINPLRFAGWCTTDLAYFAYNINIYEYFMENKKPDWEYINSTNKGVYAFVMGEVPLDIEKSDIMSFDIESFKKDTKSEILDVREFDYRIKPMFCVLFIKADSYENIKHILNLDMRKYIRLKSAV